MNNYNPYNNFYNNQPNNSGIIWVQGEQAAKAYQLTPNSNIMLLDSDNDGVFYIKTSYNVGMCSLRTFVYEEVKDTHKTDYVTHDELMKAINELKGAIKNEQTIQTAKQLSIFDEQK